MYFNLQDGHLYHPNHGGPVAASIAAVLCIASTFYMVRIFFVLTSRKRPSEEAAMGIWHKRRPEDRAMIVFLSFAMFLGLAFGVFALVSIATHTFDVKSGLGAAVASAIFSLICYRALRKRLMG